MKQLLFILLVLTVGLGLFINDQTKARDLQANLSLAQKQSEIWQCATWRGAGNSNPVEALWSQCIGK